MDASSPIEQFDQLCLCIALGRNASRQLSAWISEFDLKEPEFRVLWLLRDEGSQFDQSRLAELMACSPAQISALVEQLRIRGLLCSQPAPGDRRRTLWSITSSGGELLSRIIKSAESVQLRAIPIVSLSRRKAA